MDDKEIISNIQKNIKYVTLKKDYIENMVKSLEKLNLEEENPDLEKCMKIALICLFKELYTKTCFLLKKYLKLEGFIDYLDDEKMILKHAYKYSYIPSEREKTFTKMLKDISFITTNDWVEERYKDLYDNIKNYYLDDLSYIIDIVKNDDNVKRVS